MFLYEHRLEYLPPLPHMFLHMACGTRHALDLGPFGLLVLAPSSSYLKSNFLYMTPSPMFLLINVRYHYELLTNWEKKHLKFHTNYTNMQQFKARKIIKIKRIHLSFRLLRFLLSLSHPIKVQFQLRESQVPAPLNKMDSIEKISMGWNSTKFL